MNQPPATLGEAVSLLREIYDDIDGFAYAGSTTEDILRRIDDFLRTPQSETGDICPECGAGPEKQCDLRFIAANCPRNKAQPTDKPRTAHSKTEYKRLKAQGADVLPPSDKKEEPVLFKDAMIGATVNDDGSINPARPAVDEREWMRAFKKWLDSYAPNWMQSLKPSDVEPMRAAWFAASRAAPSASGECVALPKVLARDIERALAAYGQAELIRRDLAKAISAPDSRGDK